MESLKLALAKPLQLVVLVPSLPLPTSKARAALPKQVPHRGCGVQCEPGGPPW